MIQNNGDKLYANIGNVLSSHLEHVVDDKLSRAVPQNGSAVLNSGLFLQQMRQLWEDHCLCMGMINDVMMYMNRVFLKDSMKPLVYYLGMDLFRDVVIKSKKTHVLDAILRALLFEIREDRNGREMDRTVVKVNVQMLSNLNADVSSILYTLTLAKTTETIGMSMYKTEFEVRFLEATAEYYKQESHALLNEVSSIPYIQRIERRIEQETQRCQYFFPTETQQKVDEILGNELILKHADRIVNGNLDGLHHMIREGLLTDIKRLHNLLSRVTNGVSTITKSLFKFVVEAGKELSESTSSNEVDPLKWIESMLGLKLKLDQVLEKGLDKKKIYLNEINAALESVFDEVPRSAEYLSLYLDDALKRGLKKKTDEEAEEGITSALGLFQYIKDRDVFERYYKQHLARRLLQGRTVSDELEKSVIGKLKVECGSQFTSKLEGMFHDMKLSIDLSIDFKRSHQTHGTGELHVNVLTTTAWPISVYEGSCLFPAEIQASMDRFARFYSMRHTGRRLTWMPNFGQADVKAAFALGSREINMSTFAMVVLVACFNGPDPDLWVDYESIQATTGIGDADLKRTLQSLSVAKFKLLTKSTKGKDINPGDRFQVNSGFSTNAFKFKLPTIAAAGKEERDETFEKIQQGRQHQIEAAIVRIMKSRKTLDHNSLVAQVATQLNGRFVADPLMVKRRIESLIDREFLERDASDRKIYNYVA